MLAIGNLSSILGAISFFSIVHVHHLCCYGAFNCWLLVLQLFLILLFNSNVTLAAAVFIAIIPAAIVSNIILLVILATKLTVLSVFFTSAVTALFTVCEGSQSTSMSCGASPVFLA